MKSIDEMLLQDVWIPFERASPPLELFGIHDGFDLYIDGCRHLPDCVTVTKVTGRILNRMYTHVGADIVAHSVADCPMFNPIYDYRQEFRLPNMSPTSTLVLKVYTRDKFTNQLIVVGYSFLNIFLEHGTESQPSSDTPGLQISLNDGAHQLRLFHEGPKGLDPMCEALPRSTGARIIPGASILVRLVKAKVDPQGKVLQVKIFYCCNEKIKYRT